MDVPTNEDGLFNVFSSSFYLDPVGNMINDLLGALESDLSIGSFNTYQGIILPYEEDLLEATTFWGP